MNRRVKAVFSSAILVSFIIPLVFIPSAHAEFSDGASMSSDNFKILDSQHGSFGGVSSSSSGSFILLGSLGDIAIGSSSITNFKLNSGFLYYPKVVAPILNTATAGTNQVSLAWTAATAFQGFSISGYNVCTKPSGGSYTCENAGNVVVYTKTGLTAGTTYTFKIEAKDGLGNIIAISNEQSAVPTAPASSGGGGGGGGGGGFFYYPTPTPLVGDGVVTITGIAYPKATITFYVDSVAVSSIQAGTNANFQATLSNLPTGSRMIGVGSQDPNGRKSLTVSFTVTLNANTTVALSDVLLPPTIDISAFQLARGDNLKIFGQAQPVSEVDIRVYSTEITNKIGADAEGAYAYNFDTKPLAEDYHTTKSRAVITNVGATPFSQLLQFTLGKVFRGRTADLNKDGKINIIDFSMLLYWWGTSDSRGLSIADVNQDGKINIIDFSVLLYQWTG
ncbi:MAG: dockerin type I domain-containing protein [Patescibacteria group bacterium]